MRKLFIVSILAGLGGGALVGAVSEGAFLNGWLAAGVLLFLACLGLGLAWRWAGGGRALGLLLVSAFVLRLGLGILMSLGLQTFGYDEVVQRSGYVYADAFSRDQEAWKLASGDQPIWSSFQREFLTDQYGGSLTLSALIYRLTSLDAHRRFLVLIVTAFAFCLGLPFFWQAVRARWNEPLATLAAWVVVLYPESVLVGASQMREPFLLGAAMVGFWAVFAARRRRRQAVGIFAAACAVMLAFSSKAAVILIGALLMCAWIEYMDEIAARRWKWLGWAVLGLAVLGLVGLSWGWLRLATSYDAGLTIRESGMVQKITDGLPDELRVPFITAYGLFQPVLPAILVDPAPFVWKTIGLLRASGWYLLAPFLLYAFVSAWRAQPEKDRRLLLWLGLSALLWVILSSARAGGDLWDNPRYRVLFLPFIALLSAWGWRWARARRDVWIWAWLGADFVFVAFFLSWYISRYTGSPVKLPFWANVALILGISGLVLLAGGVWNLRRQGKSLRDEGLNLLNRLKAFVSVRPAPPDEPVPTRRGWRAQINRWDGLVLLFFLGFAVLYFLGRLQGNFPTIILTGDAGNIASFAAAQDHPAWFQGDPALADAQLTGYYATLHMPLLKTLAPLAGGDYAWAFTWLLAPHIFLQLCGFYLLGRVLFHRRWWAFLLALLTAMPFIDVGMGEFWGVWRDALPRVTFQSVLPYLLALVVVWRGQPRRWPWLMILAGLMVFLHSISTPAWGFAIWLGLWLYHPAEWHWPRRLGVMLGLGLLFLLALSPFALNFLGYQSRGASTDAPLVMKVLTEFQPENLLNAPAALLAFLGQATIQLLLPLALLGFALLWKFGRVERRLVAMVLLWGGGLLVVAVALPSGERWLEQTLRILPIDTELPRNMRYLVPWLLIFWLWPLADLAPRLLNPRAAQAALLVGLLLVGGWSATHTPEGRRMLEAVTCLTRGRLVCGDMRDLTGLVENLRAQTPQGAPVFNYMQDDSGSAPALSIRYSALRPMVYTVRDAGLFVYTNRPALKGWLALTERVHAIQDLPDPAARLAQLIPLAKELKAQYLSLDFPLSPETAAGYPVDLLWQNKTYSLFKLK